MAFPSEGRKIPFSPKTSPPPQSSGDKGSREVPGKGASTLGASPRGGPLGDGYGSTDLMLSFPPAPVGEKATSGTGRLGDSSQGVEPGVFYLPVPKCPALRSVHPKGM